MKIVQINAQYTCDSCNIEISTTDGSIPDGWKEGSRIDISEDSSQEVRIHIGPTCIASKDPFIIQTIANLLIS